MRAYTANILPTDAAYYTLENASLSGGVLTLLPGGSATIDIDSTLLPSLTEYFRIAATMSPSSDAYDGGIYIIVKALSSSGQYITHFCNVVTDSFNLFSTEIELIAEDYTTLQVIIRSDVNCSFTSWELDPQADNSDVTVEIEGVRQSLPRLLYDYNTVDMTVGQAEQNVAMIAMYLTANTDLQGHFAMTCTASERCTVYLRFIDNMMTELFSPLLFTINAGLTTLTVPHAYLEKLAGVHNIMVTAQVTNGYLSVPVRGVLFTIDGGYLAGRLMDPDMDLTDISLKCPEGNTEPTEIWGVGIDNNVITVKKRSYDIKQANEVWEAVYTLGEGSEAAIEFNGVWKEYEEVRSLITEETPWVFFVQSGTLYAQRGAVLDTKISLATDVTKVNACRAWLYDTTTYDNDLGLIVAYVKSDGIAYYRQYRIPLGGSIIWTAEVALPFTTSYDIQYISVSRLNDFRVAFTARDSTGAVYCLISTRYYQANSVPNTHISVANVALSFGWATNIEPEALEAWNDSNFDTYIRFNYPIVDMVNKQSYFTLHDSNSVYVTITDTEKYDDYTIKLITERLSGKVTPLTVTFTYSDSLIHGPLEVAHGTTTFAVQTFSLTFDFIDFSPKAYGHDHVTVAAASITATLIPLQYKLGYELENVAVTTVVITPTVTLVTYKNGYEAENIAICAVSLSITLTHVGTSPL